MSDSCVKLLADKNLTIVFIESATAGYLAHRFSVSPYSGDVLMGGLVCYDVMIKKNVLNISSQLIDKYTPESLEVTQELVKQSPEKFEADLHVACTGLLKPGGSETEEKPVGTFFYCIGYKDEVYSFRSLCNGPSQQKLRSIYSLICKGIIDVVSRH
ncbi:CinA family protein [Psychrobacter sp. APC 3281]|jgi:nicotinamide-nucleotide amidase|uniref:CinA family protein n=1 Tax=Psychrobacter sp. APC 3281 TaxID=3035190 RepID=UPI0025B4B0F0|nr:CinA family protein [Psychrobacter sp. APC 3281]MDN3446125.1 CinA family protein [Psychrobacter sp. APC 3281]